MANLVAEAVNYAQIALKWKAQYDQMTKQINRMRQQYESLTGSRNLGQIMNNPAVRRYLPEEWQDVYRDIRRGGYSGLSDAANIIYESNKVFDACTGLPDQDQRLSCEARAVKPAQDQGYALDAYELAEQRLDQIDSLMQAIDTTTDPKGIAELQARIAVEQTNLQNEAVKLQLYQMASAAEDRIAEQRQREIEARTWSNPGVIDIAPLSFGNEG